MIWFIVCVGGKWWVALEGWGCGYWGKQHAPCNMISDTATIWVLSFRKGRSINGSVGIYSGLIFSLPADEGILRIAFEHSLDRNLHFRAACPYSLSETASTVLGPVTLLKDLERTNIYMHFSFFCTPVNSGVLKYR